MASGLSEANGLENGPLPKVHLGDKPLLIEMNIPVHFNMAQREKIVESGRVIKEEFRGTPLEGVPIVFTYSDVGVRIHSPMTDDQLDKLAEVVAEKIESRESARNEPFHKALSLATYKCLRGPARMV